MRTKATATAEHLFYKQ